jgi:phage terminase large subunit
MPLLQLPKAFGPLLEPRRYKVMYGGRGSGKSWQAARALIYQSTLDPLRVLCAREVMRTIADSVHRLLADQIEALGLNDWFTITDGSITGRNGAEFLFAGLRAMDAHKIKSFEGVDVAWVEEGQAVSKKSWETLIPTIRAEDSEIWVTWNPELDTDDTYQRFVVHPPEEAWVQRVTWRDNPWFPAVLEAERLSLQKRDPVEYQHVWEGKPRTVVVGAIYAGEVTTMIEDRRVRPVPYDPKMPVHTIWDLGWNDQTSIIFVQRLMSEVRLIDYAEESFLRFDEWAKRLRDKPYLYGSHWLPHDGENETQAAKGLSAQTLLTPLLRMRPKIIPRASVKENAIRAARMMFPRVYADEVKADRLMTCLKRYRRGVPESTGEPGSPVHDEYSHGADAFAGLAMIVDQLTNDTDEFRLPPVKPYRPADPGLGF